jgi:hypothetical protein
MAAAVDERAHDLSWSRITGDVLDVYREVAA